jgi:hypothetical protein
MKYFWQKIRDNIWNHAYYEEILAKPLASSFKYYFKMILWLALIYTALCSVLFLPEFVSTARQVVFNVAQSYPADLKITLRDGQASVNIPEPVIIPLSDVEKDIFKNIKNKIGAPANLIVIDTRTEFALTEFSNYRSLFVLKKDSLIGMDSNGGVRVSKIPTGSIVISSVEIKSIAAKIQSMILILAPLSVLAIYLFGILFFIFTIGYLILIALFAWLLLYVAKRDLTFKQSLGVTLHACTLALLINFFIFVLYPSLSINFPFLVAFTLLITYLNLIRKPKTMIAVPVAPTNISVDTVARAEEKKDSQ